MIFAPSWHRMPFKIPFSCRLHINAIAMPELDDLKGTAHHQGYQIQILPWPYQGFHNFLQNRIIIIAVNFRNITHEVVVACCPRTRSSCIRLFCNHHIRAIFRSSDCCLQAADAAANNQNITFYNIFSHFHFHTLALLFWYIHMQHHMGQGIT